MVQISKFKNGFYFDHQMNRLLRACLRCHNAFCVRVSTATEQGLRFVLYLLQELTENFPVVAQQMCNSVYHPVSTLTFCPLEFKAYLGHGVLRHAAPALAMFHFSAILPYI